LNCGAHDICQACHLGLPLKNLASAIRIRNQATVVNHMARRIVESQGKPLPPPLLSVAPK